MSQPSEGPFAAIARRFLDLYRRGVEPDFTDIDFLASQALADWSAVQALYRVVEGLCDDFSPAGVRLCNRVLLKILWAGRRLPALASLDAWLRSSGFDDEAAFLERYARLLVGRPLVTGHGGVPSSAGVATSRTAYLVADGVACGQIRPPGRAPAVIAVLSRVTIGADVALTSIFLQRLRRRFPAAELLLVGPAHLGQLFAGLQGVRLAPISFPRRGSIPERLGCVVEIRRLLEREANMAGGELLLVDPDSRLSQLGLQPLWREDLSCYFPSRILGGEEESLAQLANQWCNRMWGEDVFAWPAVWPAASCQRIAARLWRRLGRRPLCVVNFGVGGNPAKRVADPFEEQVVAMLASRWPGVVLYDAGRSPFALERVRRALAEAAAQGVPVGFATEDEAGQSLAPGCRLVGFRGSIGVLAALLERADAFVGYDSCCQHLAAAAGLGGVVVFAGAPHQRFRNRWRPQSRHASLTVLPVADGRRPGGEGATLQAVTKLVEEVAAALGLLRVH